MLLPPVRATTATYCLFHRATGIRTLSLELSRHGIQKRPLLPGAKEQCVNQLSPLWPTVGRWIESVAWIAYERLSRLNSEKIVVIGGEAVLPDSFVKQLTRDRSNQRIAGKNRYETVAQFSKHPFPNEPPTNVHLFRGDTYVDAVAVGMSSNNPLLLMPPCGPTPKVVVDEVNRLKPENLVALGGQQAISEQTLDDLVAGKDREGQGVAIPAVSDRAGVTEQQISPVAHRGSSTRMR